MLWSSKFFRVSEFFSEIFFIQVDSFQQSLAIRLDKLIVVNVVESFVPLDGASVAQAKKVMNADRIDTFTLRCYINVLFDALSLMITSSPSNVTVQFLSLMLFMSIRFLLASGAK